MALTKNYTINYNVQAQTQSAIENINRLRTAVETLSGVDKKTNFARGFSAIDRDISSIEGKLKRLNELSTSITPTVSLDLVKFDKQLQLMQRSVSNAASKMRQALQSALVGSNNDFLRAQSGLAGSSVSKAAKSMLAQYIKNFDEQIAATQKSIANREAKIEQLRTATMIKLPQGITGKEAEAYRERMKNAQIAANKEEEKEQKRQLRLEKKNLENLMAQRESVKKDFEERIKAKIGKTMEPETRSLIDKMKDTGQKIRTSLANPYTESDPFFDKSKKKRDAALKNHQEQMKSWRMMLREQVLASKFGIKTMAESGQNVPIENLKTLANSIMGQDFSAKVKLIPDITAIREVLLKPFDAKANVTPVNLTKLKTDIEAIKPVIKAEVITEKKKGGKVTAKTAETVVTETTKKGAKLTESKAAKAMESFGTFIANITSKPIEINVSLIPNLTELKAKLAEAKLSMPATLKVNTELLAKSLTEMKPVTIPVVAKEKAQTTAKGKVKAKPADNTAQVKLIGNTTALKEQLAATSLSATVALNGDITSLDKKIKGFKFSASVTLTPLMGDIEKALGKIAIPNQTAKGKNTAAPKQSPAPAAPKVEFPRLTKAEEALMNKLFTTFPKLSKEQETAAKRMSAAQKKLQANNTETNVTAFRNAEEKFTQARQKYTEAFKQLRPLMVKQFQSTASRILTEQEALKGFEAQNTVSILSAKKNLTKAQKTQLDEARKTLTALRAPEKIVTPPVKKQVPLKGDVSGLKKSVENAKLSSGVNLTPDLKTLSEKVKAAKLSASVKLNPDIKELRERVKAAKLSASITLAPNIKELNEKVRAGKLSTGVNLTPNTKELKEKILAAKLQASVSLTGDTKALKEKVTAAKLTANASISPNVTELKEKLEAYKSLSANVKLKGDLKGLDTQVKAAKLTAKVSLTPIMTAIEEKLASLTANVSLKAQQTGAQTQNTTTIIPAPTGGTATGANTTATTTTTTTTNSSGNKKSSKSKLPPKTSWGARYANDTDYQKERFALLNKQNALAAAYRNKASEYISRLGFNQVQSSVLVPLRKYFSKAAGMTNIPVENGGLNSMQQFQVVDQARRLMLANDNIKIPPIFEEVHGRLMGEAAAMAAVVKKPAPVVTPPTSPVSKKDSFGKKYAGDASYQRERLSLLKTQGENAQILREISSDYIKRLGFTQGEANSLVPYRKFINKAVEMTGVNLKNTGMTDNARFRVLDQARLLMKASGVAVPKIIDQKFNNIFAKNRTIGAEERERTRADRMEQIQRLQAKGYNLMLQFTSSPTEAQSLMKYRHYFSKGADLAGVTPSANLSYRQLLDLLQGTKMVMEDRGVAVPPALMKKISDTEKAIQTRTDKNRIKQAESLRKKYLKKIDGFAQSKEEINDLLKYRHFFNKAMLDHRIYPLDLKGLSVAKQGMLLQSMKNKMQMKRIPFPKSLEKHLTNTNSEVSKWLEQRRAEERAINTAAHMQRYNKSYANAILGASQYAPTFREQAELIKYRKFFKQANKELGFSTENMPKTLEEQLKVMQNAQQRMANSGIVSPMLNNRISDTQRRIAAEDERATRAASRMVPLPVRGKKGFYDRLRGWSYPFTGNTSFGARTPVAYDMLKGMGMMYGVGEAMSTISEAFSNSVEYQNTMETAKAILQRNYKGNDFNQEYNDMVKTVRNVAMKTKFTAPEAADAARFMAMAGLDIPMIKASIAPIADLAVIGDNDLGFIADKMTNIQTAFGIAPKQMRKVADMMTSTITSTNTDITMLAESMEYAAPMARMANWKKGASGSLAEALAIIGVMGNSGIQASMAGTTLRMMYQNIMKTTKEQRKAWNSLGINLRDKDGSPRNMISLLDELARKIDITSDKGKAKLPVLMSQLFRVTAGPGAAAIVQNIDKVKALAAQNMAATGNSEAISKVKQSDIKGLWAQVTSSFTEAVLKVFESKETQGYINDKLKKAISFLQSPEFVNIMKDLGSLIRGILKPMMIFVKYWVWLFTNMGDLVKYVAVTQAFLTQIGFLLTPVNQLVGVISKLGGLITGIGKGFQWLFGILKIGKATQAAVAATEIAGAATSGAATAAGAVAAGAARGAATGAATSAAAAAAGGAASAAGVSMWRKAITPAIKGLKIFFAPLISLGLAMPGIFGWMKRMFTPFSKIPPVLKMYDRWGMIGNVKFWSFKNFFALPKVLGSVGFSLLKGITSVVARLGLIGFVITSIYGVVKMIIDYNKKKQQVQETIASKERQLATYRNVIANQSLVHNGNVGMAGRNLMQNWGPVAKGINMNPTPQSGLKTALDEVNDGKQSVIKKTPLSKIKQYQPLFAKWDDNYNRLIAPTELARQYDTYYKGFIGIMNGSDKSLSFKKMTEMADNIQRYEGESRASYVQRKNNAIRNMIAKGAVYNFGANSLETQGALAQINDLFRNAGDDIKKIQEARKKAYEIAEKFNPQNENIQNATRLARSYAEIGNSTNLAEFREWWTGAYNVITQAINGTNGLFSYYNGLYNIILGNGKNVTTSQAIDKIISGTIIQLPNINGDIQNLILKVNGGMPMWNDFYEQCKKLNITFNNGILEHCNILDGIMKTLANVPELTPYIDEINKVIERMKKEAIKKDWLLHPFRKEGYVNDNGVWVDQGFRFDSIVGGGMNYTPPRYKMLEPDDSPKIITPKLDEKPDIPSVIKPQKEETELPKPKWAVNASLPINGENRQITQTLYNTTNQSSAPAINMHFQFGDIRIEGGANQENIAAQIESCIMAALESLKGRIGSAVTDTYGGQESSFMTAMM